MPTGAGASPAGSALAGIGTIDSAPAPGLVPLPDPRTGVLQTGRYIDQATGDYVFTADGRLQGMPTVNQKVLLAIKNNVDISSLPEKGPNFKQSLTTIVANALAALIASKEVSLERVDVVEPSRDSGVAIAWWRDLTAGAPQDLQQTPV